MILNPSFVGSNYENWWNSFMFFNLSFISGRESCPLLWLDMKLIRVFFFTTAGTFAKF